MPIRGRTYDGSEGKISITPPANSALEDSSVTATVTGARKSSPSPASIERYRSTPGTTSRPQRRSNMVESELQAKVSYASSVTVVVPVVSSSSSRGAMVFSTASAARNARKHATQKHYAQLWRERAVVCARSQSTFHRLAYCHTCHVLAPES